MTLEPCENFDVTSYESVYAECWNGSNANSRIILEYPQGDAWRHHIILSMELMKLKTVLVMSR